jgi:hypothetical protein
MTARVLRLEKGDLRSVWSGPVRTWTNWLDLTVTLTPDGSTLKVQDVSANACPSALCQYHEKENAGVHSLFGAVLEEGCAGRGDYAWSQDRYIRVGTQPKDNFHCPSLEDW